MEAPATEAAPPAAAAMKVVGFQFPSVDTSIVMNGSLVRLQSVATNFTTLGLIAGEWIYLGGDTAGTTFATNKGFARISVIAAIPPPVRNCKNPPIFLIFALHIVIDLL